MIRQALKDIDYLAGLPKQARVLLSNCYGRAIKDAYGEILPYRSQKSHSDYIRSCSVGFHLLCLRGFNCNVHQEKLLKYRCKGPKR